MENFDKINTELRNTEFNIETKNEVRTKKIVLKVTPNMESQQLKDQLEE